MKRYAEEDLKAWFIQKDRPPLIIRGARQVGKTSLVRAFCLQNKLSLIELNLEYTLLKSLAKPDVKIEEIIDEIELLTKKKIGDPQSLIFFDEIQESPKLIQLLRYFYELRPDVAIIAAGSLLEFVINEGQFSFPVGRVNFYHLGPMSFGEFLLANGEEVLVQKITNRDLSLQATHDICLGYLKKYFYLGGMPKVVANYIETKSMVVAREIQEQILQTYIADFPKYRKRLDVKRVSRVFQSAASMIGKKINYQALDRESKSKEIKLVVELLIDAKILIPVYHCEASGVPLLATQDDSLFKYFFLDIGILNCLHRLDYDTLQQEFQNNFLIKGVLAEQFVAQHLIFFDGHKSLPRLNYWLRDKGSQKGEIDFLVEHKGTIWPIEVKSSSGGKLKSLFYFSADKKLHKAIKFSLAPLDIKQISHKINESKIDITLSEYPLYVTEFLINYL